ncbi:MAG TPA: O-antigen ligase family protein [Chloroflexia bacterium]|nr:O-antigen ligase family protein [Chloroflexia bacterium]
MQRVRSILRGLLDNPVARAALALALLLGSVGGLSLSAYADSYFNAGVTWGADTPPAPLAAVNPMGVNLFLEKEVERDKIVRTLDMARDAGFKWVRQGFAWNDIEISAKGNYTDTRNPGPPVDAWAKYDYIVEQIAAHGMGIMARLDSPPLWARMEGDDVQTFHKGPPRDNNDFGDFAAAVASRYKGKIKYFQIWNEPNLWGEWGGHPVSAEEYTALLKVAYTRIKEVDPEAVVVSAALAPTADDSAANRNDILFLEDMYRRGAAPYFDVMSTMVYGLGEPPSDRRLDLDRLSFGRPILLRRVMEKYGDFDTPIWISEYAWLSLPPGLENDPVLSLPPWEGGKNIWGRSVTEQEQARYLVEGFERARSEWPWMGVMFVWHLRNPDADPREPATYFGITLNDFEPRPAYHALRDYSARVPAEPQMRDRPLISLLGFGLLYVVFGLLTAASGAFFAASLGRWASAALNIPRGRYGESAREIARNGAAVAGVVGLFALYYVSQSTAVALLALAGCGAILLFKPSIGLALTALAIPLFWYPKEFRGQNIHIAETVLLLTFAAVLVRRGTAWLLPGPAARLGFASPNGRANGPMPNGRPAPADERATIALPSSGIAHTPTRERRPPPEPDDTLRPAAWPARPTTVLAEPARPTAVLRTATLAEPEAAPGAEQPRSGPREAAAAQPLTRLLDRFLAWNRQDAFAAPAVVLMALGTLTLLTVANPDFLKDSARQYRWVIVEPVLFYFLLTDVIAGRRGLLRVLDFFTASASAVALFGLFQFVTGSGTLDVEGVSRITAVYRHPNNLALFLERAAVLVGVAALFLPWGWRKSLYLLAALPIGATLLLTFSRGAWVGVVVAVVLAVSVGLRWLPGRPERGLPRAFKLWLAGLGVAAVGGALALALLFPSLPERLLSPDSGLMRFRIWDASLRMALDHPVMGVGLDQFLNQWQDKYVPPLTEQQASERWTAHPHNIVLDWWLNLGVLGLVLLIWLLWRYYREAIALVRWASSSLSHDPLAWAIALGLLAMATAMVVHGLVDNSYFLMDLALIFWMCCGVMQLLRAQRNVDSV